MRDIRSDNQLLFGLDDILFPCSIRDRKTDVQRLVCRIYPKIGQIYLEPDNNWGRAPFYSHEKKFAGYTFSTFTFNLLMLGIFALLVIISIFAEFPGKYLNKGSD